MGGDLARLSMEPPDRKTASPDYKKLEQKGDKLMEAWKNFEDKLRQQGYPISDSDTDSTS